MIHPIPFTDAYWVLPNNFLAGPYPGDQTRVVSDEKLKRLAESGIRCVINLMEDDELAYYGNINEPSLEKFRDYIGAGDAIRWMRKPIRDMDIPSKQGMIKILDEIDQAISDGLPVYVHCLGGIGRTGTVVGCYLARHGIAAGEDVLDMISELRQGNENAHVPSPQSDVQRKMVRMWRKGE